MSQRGVTGLSSDSCLGCYLSPRGVTGVVVHVVVLAVRPVNCLSSQRRV